MAGDNFVAEVRELFVFEVAEERDSQFLLSWFLLRTNLERSFSDDDVMCLELEVLFVAEDDCTFDDDGVEFWWGFVDDECLSSRNYNAIHIARWDIASPSSFVGEFVCVEESLEHGCFVPCHEHFEARVFCRGRRDVSVSCDAGDLRACDECGDAHHAIHLDNC